MLIHFKGPDPCVLNCLPKGGRQYFRQALKVHDGTKCYEDGSLDVCVDGLCLVCKILFMTIVLMNSV